MHQPKNTLNKIKVLKNINLLHVSAPEFHPQGFFRIEGLKVKHANLDIASSSLG
jgi:hypothetical protein